MLTIRREQMQALQVASNRRFARRTRDRLRERVGTRVQGMSDACLEEFIVGQVFRAQKYGIFAEDHLLAFVDLSLCVSPQFDRHPPFQQILSDSSLWGDQKIPALLEAATELDWEQAFQLDTP